MNIQRIFQFSSAFRSFKDGYWIYLCHIQDTFHLLFKFDKLNSESSYDIIRLSVIGEIFIFGQKIQYKETYTENRIRLNLVLKEWERERERSWEGISGKI